MTSKTPTGHLGTFLDKRSQNAMQRQQLIAYLIATGLAMVGMSLHLVNVLGAKMPVLHTLSVVVILLCAVTFVLWLRHKVSLIHAFTFTAMIVLAVQSAKMTYIALALPYGQNYLIVMNAIISMMLMVLLAISYLRLVALVTGVVNAATLVLTGVLTSNGVMWQFVTLIMLFTVFFMFMADMMYRNVKLIQDENTKYHSDELLLLQTLRLNRKEVEAYVEMCRNSRLNDADTDRLFGMLSERSQRNVINAVERKKAIDDSRNKELSHTVPGLTPMELEVARLVLRGMKLSQIVNYTGKSETNISVVRSRIRKKLGLASGDDLRQALLNRLKQA